MAAVFSPCRTWRYRLDREFLFGGPTVAFMLHNPSTADEQSEDPTSRRGIGFARAWGAGRLVFVNPWAFCATDKADLWKAPDPVGPENDRHIAEVAREVAQTGGYFIAAWGSVSPPKARRTEALSRLKAVESVIRGAGCPLKALAVTTAGEPRHPLYLPAEAAPFDWTRRQAADVTPTPQEA
ncbi:DUF1643 domain-containing protein [Xanthobacter autotrophicus]|uniref:DUF1643 domain-containing protein n=1 Tax=Xanthobacter autotrophicus TaxID=280 RepID=UPI00372ABEFE